MEAVLLGSSGRTVLSSAVVSIGRTADNQMMVNDAKVSSHHAEIRLVGQSYSITDLASMNGTFVNEQRLAGNVPRPLNAGDMIRVGDTSLRYEVSGLTPDSHATFDQASSPAYTPTVAAAPSEYTGYGVGAQQPSTPQQPFVPLPQQRPYTPQQSFVSPPQQGPYTPQQPQQPFVPPPQQGPYTPQQPLYQPYSPSAPLQPPYAPAGPGSGANYSAPASPQGYAQQAYVPPGVPPYGVPPQQFYPPPSSIQRKPGGGMKTLLIVLAVILVVILLAGGGFLYRQLTQPQPVINLSSQYHVGSTLAGSTGTMFHVTGQKFSANSAITFLLDGASAPGSVNAQSDANGMLKTDLTITDGWTVGPHTLTAQDAGNFVTKAGVAVMIVPQGQANTPGLNGAPPDDMQFSLHISIQAQDTSTGQQLNPVQQTLMITGQPDPAGGTVCQSSDNGQPQTGNGTLTGGTVTYSETISMTCSGTYKGGKLTYTQMVTSDRFIVSDGRTCMPNAPYINEMLSGTFTAPNSINGTISRGTITIPCSNGGPLSRDALTGTWKQV